MSSSPGDSRFFTYHEFAGGGCGRPARITREALDDLVATWLHPLRVRFGRVTVHSGCRSVAHNRAVGGAPASKHVYARQPSVVAADVSAASGRPSDWLRFMESLDPVCGLGLYRTHVHVDNRRERVRWSGL